VTRLADAGRSVSARRTHPSSGSPATPTTRWSARPAARGTHPAGRRLQRGSGGRGGRGMLPFAQGSDGGGPSASRRASTAWSASSPAVAG
jgi:hypothetical protein